MFQLALGGGGEVDEIKRHLRSKKHGEAAKHALSTCKTRITAATFQRGTW